MAATPISEALAHFQRIEENLARARELCEALEHDKGKAEKDLIEAAGEALGLEWGDLHRYRDRCDRDRNSDKVFSAVVGKSLITLHPSDAGPSISVRDVKRFG